MNALKPTTNPRQPPQIETSNLLESLLVGNASLITKPDFLEKWDKRKTFSPVHDMHSQSDMHRHYTVQIGQNLMQVLQVFQRGPQGSHILSTSLINLSTSFTTRIERSKIQLQTAWYYIDVFNTGNDIYTVDKGFRKNGFFDFHQTFVAQFTTEMQFGWSGEDQITLGSDNGLRGYNPQQFSGEKMMLLHIESRTLCGGKLFGKIDDGLAAVATFIAKPFIKRSVKVGLVLSATAFADVGYIWNGKRTFKLSAPKRSVGIGLRGSFSHVSGPSIFRIGLAFPLDIPLASAFEPRIFSGFNQTF